ncbi:MAG TPA: lysophospholipid acyltransferase family protein [Candidatus Saccharimonadaceae bacterium]|nr:lysophospholipid acyltransferase family protein [Candidatus Saccharimonadaceae bacterium]
MSAYYSAARFVVGAVMGVVTGWEVTGREHVPRAGGVIVASNHISFWDPPLVGAALPRESHFLAKEELFETPILGPLIRGVNAIPIRRGVADMSGLSRAIEILKRGSALLMFPEGSRMRDGELHPARPGVGMIAMHADVPILPCYISGSGRPGKWWYRGARVRISFGAARPWSEYADPEQDLSAGRALYQSIGDGVMRDVAELRAGQQRSASRGAA